MSKRLGSQSVKFHLHINTVVSKAGGLAQNLLQSTINRSNEFMKNLFISHVRPILEFSSPLWNMGYIGDLRNLESVQRRWTKRVDGLSHLSYHERLMALNMYSIKGRLLKCDLILI